MLTRMPYLERDGDVFVLHLGDRDVEVSENRFHPDRLAAIHSLLDEVEAHDGPAALVTAATGKFWSNGLDIDWVGANLPPAAVYRVRRSAKPPGRVASQRRGKPEGGQR